MVAPSALLLPPGDVASIKVDQQYAALRYIGVSQDSIDQSKPVWRIYRETFLGNVHTQEFAQSGKFTCVWDSRATYFPSPPADVLDSNTDTSSSYSLDALGARVSPATEATLASVLAGLATLAKDASFAALAKDATLSALAKDASLATLAKDASLATLAKDASLTGAAKDSTLASLLTRANLQATEATLAALSPILRVSSCAMVIPQVNVATSSVVIAPANAARKGIIMWNNSANSTYVSFGATSVAARCTNIIATFTSWQHVGPLCYTGQISAIRNAGSGEVVCWELT